MSKKIHFVSGLPRSGSTLLCNLLAQNPAVHATGTSPLFDIGFQGRQMFDTEESKTMDRGTLETMYCSYVRAGLEHAYDSVTRRPLVADKSRSWIGQLDLLFKIWPDAKVLVPVRDIRGILSSMEKKRLAHPTVFNGAEKANPANWTTIEKRVQGWLATPPVGIAIERLHDAIRFKDRLHFVHAEELAADPAGIMAKVWGYLGEEFAGHDFNQVAQYTQEADIGWPYGDHIIRSKVEPLKPDWNEVLGRGLSEQIRQKFEWVNEL